MVDFVGLNHHNASRPFAPFWITLRDGETIHVTHANQAVVTRSQFVFTPDRQRLRRIAMEDIAAHGVLAPSNGNRPEDDLR